MIMSYAALNTKAMAFFAMKGECCKYDLENHIL